MAATNLFDQVKDPELRKRLETLSGGGSNKPVEVPHLFEDPLGFTEGLAVNAYRDIKGLGEAIIKLPEFVGYAFTHNPFDTASLVVKGIFEQYSDLVRDPGGTFAKRPVTTLMDVFAGVGVGSKVLRLAGATATATGKTGILSRAVRMYYERGLSSTGQAVNTVMKDYLENLHPKIWEHKQEWLKVIDKYKKDPAIQQDFIYAMQRTRNPFIDADRALGVEAPLARLEAKLGRSTVTEELTRMRSEYDAYLNLMNNSGLLEQVDRIENYFLQMWKPVGKSRLKRGKVFEEAVNRFKTEAPMQNPRKWESFVKGLEADLGLVPMFDRAEDFLRFYKDTAVTAHANARLIADLWKTTADDGTRFISVDQIPGYVFIKDKSMILNRQKMIAADIQAKKLGIVQEVGTYDDLPTELKRARAVGAKAAKEERRLAGEARGVPEFLTDEIGLSRKDMHKMVSFTLKPREAVRKLLKIKGSRGKKNLASPYIGIEKAADNSGLYVWWKVDDMPNTKLLKRIGAARAIEAPVEVVKKGTSFRLLGKDGNVLKTRYKTRGDAERALTRRIEQSSIGKKNAKFVKNMDEARMFIEDTIRAGEKSIARGLNDRRINPAVGNVAEIAMPAGVWMHPEVVPLYKTLMGSRFNGDWANTFSRFNAVVKKAALSFSLFHMGALTESAVGVLGAKGIPIGWWTKDKFALDGQRARAHIRGLEIMKDPERGRELVKRGVIPASGEVIDAQRTLWKQQLDDFTDIIDSKLKGTWGKKAGDLLKRSADWFDGIMWDRYHNGLKAYSYYVLKEDMIKRFGKTRSIDEISDTVASWVNDAYGGQSWQRLFVDPKMQQQLSWLLLAPDWTLSNMRVAFRPLGELSKAVRKKLNPKKYVDDLGNPLKDPDPIVIALGTKYWRNMLFGQFVFGNTTNLLFSAYANTQRTTDNPFALDLSKGHLMHQNDKGSTTSVVHPSGKDAQGRTRYIRFGKQMREPLHWLQDPMKTLGGKMSPALQNIWTQISGASPSGFEAPWKRQNLDFVESLPERAKALFKTAMPISGFGFSDQSFLTIAPNSAATTGYKLIQEYKRAIRRNDQIEIRQIHKLARRNGYDFQKLFNMARRDIAREERLAKKK